MKKLISQLHDLDGNLLEEYNITEGSYSECFDALLGVIRPLQYTNINIEQLDEDEAQVIVDDKIIKYIIKGEDY